MATSGYDGLPGYPNLPHFLHESQEPMEPSLLEDSLLMAELAIFTHVDLFDSEESSGDNDAHVDVNTGSHAIGIGESPVPLSALNFELPDLNIPPIDPFSPAGLLDNSWLSSEAVGSNYPPPEEISRLIADDDKRRRNTAASARFRVRKKAREQALEKQVKDLTNELDQAKNRITRLDIENKWLRDLARTHSPQSLDKISTERSKNRSKEDETKKSDNKQRSQSVEIKS